MRSDLLAIFRLQQPDEWRETAYFVVTASSSGYYDNVENQWVPGAAAGCYNVAWENPRTGDICYTRPTDGKPIRKHHNYTKEELKKTRLEIQ